MSRHSRKYKIMLTNEERNQLKEVLRSNKTCNTIKKRCQILLALDYNTNPDTTYRNCAYYLEDIDAKNDSIDCRCIDSRQDGSGCIGRIRTDDPGQGDDAQEAGNKTAGIEIIPYFPFPEFRIRQNSLDITKWPMKYFMYMFS